MNDAALRALIARGEGQTNEFKESFAAEREAIESLCAFSHADGGIVIFGVRDNGAIVGVTLGRGTTEGFANKCSQNVAPSLTPKIHEFELDGKKLVTASVDKAPDDVVMYAFGVARVRVGKTNQIMSPDEVRRRYHVGFRAQNDRVQPTPSPPAANPSWEQREKGRIRIYQERRGLFLGHSWEPSELEGQIADIVIFLRQHDAGEGSDRPLSDGRVKSVEYHLGRKFFDHTVVVGRESPDFRLSISAYGPVLCLAQVNFDDGALPVELERYIDF